MKQSSLFKWLINNLTYPQIYIFICSFFFLSVIPISFFWIGTHIKQVQLINDQLEELQIERVLKNLFNELQQHRQLVQDYLMGKKEALIPLQALESQINLTIKEAIEANHSKHETSTHKPSIWQKVNPYPIDESWKALIQELPHLTLKQNEILHNKIIRNLIIQFGYLSARLGISNFKEIENYTLIETIFLRLPYLQENLSEFLLTMSLKGDLVNKSSSNERLPALISLIESDLTYLGYGINLKNDPNELEQVKILELLNQYRHSIQTVMKATQDPSIIQDPSSQAFSQFLLENQEAIKKGYQLWEEGLQELTQIFVSEKTHVRYQSWLIPLVNFLLKVFAFFLGLIIILMGSARLSQLTAATNSFTNGNLSTRVPDTYQDEIGLQAQAFNRMAQKLEEIINHLYELLDATTALANGNLTARIPLRHDESEFDQVAQSFNKMAETFETIIGRLQQIGFMLTTSASEIAAASKEQETIVVEQEATTREIAVATNDISSTAKEFANTMNEVSQVAEQTANLALKGKSSLNDMEAIMRQMVDASGSIGAKLAVLNEKASNITSVITTITKVADQTNLLSLNASIEAEKAGEYGRSFAVIAREIRRLADQTAIATLDIEKIVNEIMTAVSSSVMGVDDFTQEIQYGAEQVRTVGEQLTTIIEQVQAFTARFELVNQGMQAQSTGAEQINEAIAQLSQTAQQTSQSIHQFHKTVQELDHAANELRILTPFSKSAIKEEAVQPLTKSERQIRSFEPTSTEATKHFNQTLSNLNIAANKLKNLNIQLRPPVSRDKDANN